MYFGHGDWNSLQGVEVQVWRGGALLRTGVVDAATDDSSIAWVAADANDRRWLVDKASGYVLKISSEQLILGSLTGRGRK